VNTILHRALDLLGNVKEALLETLAPGVHVDRDGVCGLAEHL
jgi:hypothetical protein